MSSTVNGTSRFRLLITPVFLYALLLPALSIDVLARLLSHASYQDRGNLALLIFYEATRTVRCILDLSVVAFLVVARPAQQAARALAWFLLFGVVAYAIAFSGGGYAGPFQEWLTRFLIGHGVSRSMLYVVFGYPDWALWLAAAALVRFSLLFPTPLEAGAIEQSGVDDRAGFMRSVPGAGLDVGSTARQLVLAARRRGWLDNGPLWTICAFGALLSIVLRSSPLKPLLWVGWFVLVAIAITAFRASYVSGDSDTRRRVRWIARSAVLGLLLFMVSGLAGLGSGTAADAAVFVSLTLAPVAVLIGFGGALLM